MLRKLSLALLLFLLAMLPAQAQESLADTSSLSLFRRGQELYDKKLYGAAQQVLRDYLARGGAQSRNLQAEASYYIAMSSMELFQADAENLLINFADNYPEHPQARVIDFRLGQFYFREREYSKAAEAFEKVDESKLSSKEREEFNFQAGYTFFNRKNYSKAKQYLAKVKDGQTDNAALASYYYGFIAYEEGNYKDALKEFNKLRENKKYRSMVAVYITQINLLEHKYDKVIEVGEEALQENEKTQDEQLEKTRLFVAEAYFMKKNYAKAAEQYEIASKRGESLSEHHRYQLGFSKFQVKDYAAAATALSGIQLQQDTLSQNVAYHRGASYLHNGEKIKARNDFNYAANIPINSAVRELATLNYAKVSYEMGFQREAIDALRTFVKNYPQSRNATKAKDLLGKILLASSNPREALDIIESLSNRSNALNEAYQKALYQYGLELYKKNNFTEAAQQFVKSLNYNHDKKVRALSYFWLAEAAYKMKDYDRSIGNHKNFLAIDVARQTPYFDLSSYSLAYAYYQKEEYTTARTYFERYIEATRKGVRNPRFTDAQLRAADCHFVVKNYSQALNYYNDVINSNVQEGDYATYQKAIIQGLQGNNEQKIKTLRPLAENPSSTYGDDAMFAIAETYMVSGNFSQAIKEYNTLNSRYGKSPYYIVSLLKTGFAYVNLDQDDKAIPIFENILSQYPYAEEAKLAKRAIENSYIDRGQTAKLEEFHKKYPSSRGVASSQDSSLYSSAFSNIKRGDCPAALKAFETYLSKYPTGAYAVDANFYAGECAMKEGSSNRALSFFNLVVSKSPNVYAERALRYAADLYFRDKDYANAVKRYEQLEEFANNKENITAAIRGQIRSNFLLGKHEKTIETAGRMINLNTATEEARTEAMLYQAKSQMALNQLDMAQAGFAQVARKTKTEAGAEAAYNLAYIEFVKERYTEAQNSILDMQKNFGEFDYWLAKGYILLSDIFVKQGDDFQAKSTLESILSNYRNDKDDIKSTAREKLKQINDRNR